MAFEIERNKDKNCRRRAASRGFFWHVVRVVVRSRRRATNPCLVELQVPVPTPEGGPRRPPHLRQALPSLRCRRRCTHLPLQ
jgi:hypothetical protein